jgi:hypothetical protein
MTSDEIISMAEKVDPYGKLGKLYEMAELTPGTLERFAALVAAADREACAKIVDVYDYARFSEECAAAIRARGEKGQS